MTHEIYCKVVVTLKLIMINVCVASITSKNAYDGASVSMSLVYSTVCNIVAPYMNMQLHGHTHTVWRDYQTVTLLFLGKLLNEFVATTTGTIVGSDNLNLIGKQTDQVPYQLFQKSLKLELLGMPITFMAPVSSTYIA